jgi:hypothetical protein
VDTRRVGVDQHGRGRRVVIPPGYVSMSHEEYQRLVDDARYVQSLARALGNDKTFESLAQQLQRGLAGRVQDAGAKSKANVAELESLSVEYNGEIQQFETLQEEHKKLLGVIDASLRELADQQRAVPLSELLSNSLTALYEMIPVAIVRIARPMMLAPLTFGLCVWLYAALVTYPR